MSSMNLANLTMSFDNKKPPLRAACGAGYAFPVKTFTIVFPLD